METWLGIWAHLSERIEHNPKVAEMLDKLTQLLKNPILQQRLVLSELSFSLTFGSTRARKIYSKKGVLVKFH